MTRVLAEYTQTIDTPQVLGTFLMPAGKWLRVICNGNQVPCEIEYLAEQWKQAALAQRGNGGALMNPQGTLMRVRCLSSGVVHVRLEDAAWR